MAVLKAQVISRKIASNRSSVQKFTQYQEKGENCVENTFPASRLKSKIV